MQLKGIQFLRFVAATAVVLFHARGTAAAYLGSGPGWHDVLRHGEAGVDLFFVISGFVICYASYGKALSAAEFLWRRAIRIVPVYWFYTFAMVALLLVIPATVVNGTPPGAEYILKSLFFLSFLDNTFPIVFVGWTLEYEVLFYLLAAATLLSVSVNMSLAAAGLAVLVLLGRLFPAHGVPALAFLTNPMLLEFAAGVLIANQLRAGRVDRVAALLVGAALVATAIVDPVHRVIVYGIPAALVVVAFSRLSNMGRWANGALVLGDASYSIYLVQAFTVPAASKLLSALWPTVPLALAAGLITLATLVAGVVSYFVIERPSLGFLKSVKPRRVLDSA